MAADVHTLLRLEVPLVVVLGERTLPLRQVRELGPGSLIELPRAAHEALDVCVRNRRIGAGRALKVGENYGVRVTSIGAVPSAAAPAPAEEPAAPAAGQADGA